MRHHQSGQFYKPTLFPGSLYFASLSRWEKDPFLVVGQVTTCNTGGRVNGQF